MFVVAGSSQGAGEIPGGGAESGYLAGSVGRALAVALAEVAEKRPQDPIEYLSLCLRKYSSNLHREQEVCVFFLRVLCMVYHFINPKWAKDNKCQLSRVATLALCFFLIIFAAQELPCVRLTFL